MVCVVHLVLCFLLMNTPAAEKNSLRLGGMEIHIGAPKSKVFSKLAESYNLKKIDEDSWLIYSKDKNPETMYSFDGKIKFQDDEVVSVSKLWGTFYNKEALDLGRALTGVLSNLSSDQKTPVVVNVTRSRESQASIESISLSVGKKNLTISLVEGPLAATVSLQEELAK